MNERTAGLAASMVVCKELLVFPLIILYADFAAAAVVVVVAAVAVDAFVLEVFPVAVDFQQVWLAPSANLWASPDQFCSRPANWAHPVAFRATSSGRAEKV